MNEIHMNHFSKISEFKIKHILGLIEKVAAYSSTYFMSFFFSS